VGPWSAQRDGDGLNLDVNAFDVIDARVAAELCADGRDVARFEALTRVSVRISPRRE
jgi:hypothetical protein